MQVAHIPIIKCPRIVPSVFYSFPRRRFRLTLMGGDVDGDYVDPGQKTRPASVEKVVQPKAILAAFRRAAELSGASTNITAAGQGALHSIWAVR